MPSKIAERIDGLGKKITKILPSMQGGILTNKWILYLVLFSAVFDLFYFYGKGDMYALTIFFIIGFLVSFFSKNMVVILILAIALTHLIRYGKNLSEGFEDDKEDGEEGFEEEEEQEGFEDKEEDDAEGFEEEEEQEGFEDKEEDDAEGFEDEEDETMVKDGFKDIEQTAQVVKELTPSNVDERAQNLIDTQKKLMASMDTLKPMLEKAEGFLQTVGRPQTDGFATLAEAYGPLMR